MRSCKHTIISLIKFYEYATAKDKVYNLIRYYITMLGALAIILSMLFIAAIAILLFIFWIFMLVDSIKRKYRSENDKIVWVLVIIFTGFIGAIIYYFAVKVDDKKK